LKTPDYYNLQGDYGKIEDLLEGKLRQKASVTAHLPKGAKDRRRQKAVYEPSRKRRKAA
jgi:hypothetical protein